MNRPVYGQIHMALNKLFGREQAHYRAPCFICGKPHERKCDFIIGMSNVNGIRRTSICNRIMCKGCSSTYSQVDNKNTVDFCPEHDRQMLEKMRAK